MSAMMHTFCRTLCVLLAICASHADAVENTDNHVLRVIEQQPGKHMEIIYGSDLAGQLLPIRKHDQVRARASFIQQRRTYLKTKNIPLFVLDAGNLLLNRRVDDLATRKLLANSIAQSYMAAGLDAMGLGEEELQLGWDELQNIIASHQLPVVNANLVAQADASRTFFPGHRLLQQDGVTIGITAVLSPALVPKALQQQLQKSGWTWIEPQLAIKQQYQHMHAAGAQLVILIAHQPWSAQLALATQLPQSWVVIAGHDGPSQQLPAVAGNSYLVHADSAAALLGNLKIVLRPSGLGLYDASDWWLLALQNQSPSLVQQRQREQILTRLQAKENQEKNIIFHQLIQSR